MRHLPDIELTESITGERIMPPEPTEQYTPDAETVCEQYTREQPPHLGTVREKRAEFDRWLAQHDAEVAAKALEDAADALDNDPVIRPSQFAWLYYPEQMKQKKRDLNFAATRLRDRAARIRREAGESS